MFKQSKIQVENLRAMDSRIMQKQGIFKNGAGSYYWKDANTNEVRANIGYSYQDQQLTLSYCCNGESYDYAIQQMSNKDKPRYHMHKMRDKLGWSYNHVPFIKRINKPLNMHHKTFKAMVAKHDEYERQFLVNFQALIDKFENM